MSASKGPESTPSLTVDHGETKIEEKEQVTRRRTFSGMFFKATLPLELLVQEWSVMDEDEKYLQVAKRIRPHGDPPPRGEMGRKLERELAQILKHIDAKAAAGQFELDVPLVAKAGGSDGD